MTKNGINEQILLHYAQYTTIFYKMNKLKGTIVISRIRIGHTTLTYSYRIEIKKPDSLFAILTISIMYREW